jgi:hypothetical protein
MMTRKSFIAIFILTLATALPPAGSRASLAQKERVKDTGLKADEAQVNGQCPVTVRFTGYVTATGPGIVKYTFTRSDGATGPVFTLEFKEAGTQYVTTSWTLGDASALPTYEGWQAIKILSPNEAESSHETGRFAIACQGAQPTFGKPTSGQIPGGKPGGGSGAPAGERATFRVTLLGFVVNHETRDTLLETDGKRDEVYQVPVVFSFDRDRGLEPLSFSVFGPVHGDTNNHPTYVRAGSASDRGGLRTGDAFPTARPWEGGTPPAPGFGFPSVLFEGELRPVHNAAVIIPSLWESDGNQELFRPYINAIERAVPTIRLTVAHILSSPELTPYEFRSRVGVAVGLETAVTLDERVFDMRDRPIGMVRLVSSRDHFSFQPQVLVLTYEGALEAVTRDDGFGPGVIEMRYEEPRELEGSYSLYFKVERVR